MAEQDAWGNRCLRYGTARGACRHWYTVPRHFGFQIRILFRDHWRLYTWTRRMGWVWSAWGDGGRAAVVHNDMPFAWRWMMAVQRRNAPSATAPAPQLPLPMAVLVNSPLLAEHITLTRYEDGTARTPGSFKVDNLGTAFRVTVYDHDAGLRCPVTGPTLEEALEAVEVMLGTIDAPWEVDRFLSEQNAKKKPKKK